MNVRLRPELEELIKRDVERAVSMLHEHESWLAANRAEIKTKIDEGYAAAKRGELIEGDEVRSRMDERKRRPL